MIKLALSFALSCFACNAFAAAPKSTAGNPGYYRFHVGEIEVNTINDGTFVLPVDKLLTHIKPGELKTSLSKNYVSDQVETSDDAFLINTGTKLVLVDTGAGSAMGPGAGHLFDSLRAAGYKPEQVDAILITHMHGDHIGGLTSNGKANFPNATLYIDKADIDFWTNPKNGEGKPEMIKKMIEGAIPALAPYQKANKLHPITANMEITPGVRTEMAHGHTPGHTVYVVENGGQKLVLLGDTIHVAWVQFERPTADMQFDSDLAVAEKYRIAAFTDAAKHGYMIGAAHLPFPGVGHLRSREGKGGFAFIPANYTR